MRPLLVLMLGCGLLVGCKDSSSPTTPTVPVNQAFTLAVGEQAAVGSTPLVLRFREVVRDSRCPANAICLAFAAGEAVLAFDIVSGSRSQAYELKTTPTGQIVRVDGYDVTLERVAPYPFSLDPIPAADYRATVRVTSR